MLVDAPLCALVLVRAGQVHPDQGVRLARAAMPEAAVRVPACAAACVCECVRAGWQAWMLLCAMVSVRAGSSGACMSRARATLCICPAFGCVSLSSACMGTTTWKHVCVWGVCWCLRACVHMCACMYDAGGNPRPLNTAKLLLQQPLRGVLVSSGTVIAQHTHLLACVLLRPRGLSRWVCTHSVHASPQSAHPLSVAIACPTHCAPTH